MKMNKAIVFGIGFLLASLGFMAGLVLMQFHGPQSPLVLVLILGGVAGLSTFPVLITNSLRETPEERSLLRRAEQRARRTRIGP